MELKEGMYVRTKDGIIGKYNVIKVFTNVPTLNGYYETKEVEREYIDDKPYRNYEVIKASNNIIDLIEVGDYVNGMEIVAIDSDRRLYVPVDLGQPYDREFNNNGCFDYTLLDMDTFKIKSIVTKEQFESMSYKVGE